MAEEQLLLPMGGMPGAGTLGKAGTRGALALRFGPWGLAAAAVGVDAYSLYKNFKGERRRNRGTTPEQIRARGAGAQQAYARRYGNSLAMPVVDAQGFPTGHFSRR
jgi:hypothetical protein